MGPNILVFMTDQQRGDTVLPGSAAIMPVITAFRREGVTFSSAYTVSPHCCPSRATFLTGLYPSEHGVWNNVNVGNTLSRGFYDGIRLFTEDLKNQGYHIYWSGKWHVSAVEGPKDRGVDVVRVTDYKTDHTCLPGTEAGKREPDTREWGEYPGSTGGLAEKKEGQIIRDGYPAYTHYGVEENPFGDRQVVDDAVELIRERKGKGDGPWFQFVGTLGPHDPYFVPQRFLDMYDVDDIVLPDNFYDAMEEKPGLYGKTKDVFSKLSEREHREAIRHYLAFCSYEDALFGQVLEALEESGERENTMVVFLSDHGDYMGEHGLWCKGLPCFEGAYHIPAVIRWPAQVKYAGRTVTDFISIADFAPTFLEAAGVDMAEQVMAGHSLMAYLRDEQPPFVRHEVYTQSNGNELYGIQRSVCTKKWKFVYNGFDRDELYHLEEDPGEMYNVFETYRDSEIVRELSEALWRFAYERSDVCVNPYIMVGLAPYGPGIIFDGSGTHMENVHENHK